MRTTPRAIAAMLCGHLAAANTGCADQVQLPPSESVSNCTVTDGDTLRCGDERREGDNIVHQALLATKPND